ncbi:hypothetical protein, partial [Nocardiopsis sp. NPDC055824]
MADISLWTRVQNSLLPREATPLHEVIRRRLSGIEVDLRLAQVEIERVRDSATRFLEAVRNQSPLSAAEAEALSADVVGDAEAVYGLYRSGIEKRREEFEMLAFTWGKPGMPSADKAYDFILTDWAGTREARHVYRAWMNVLKSRVHLDPGQRTGDPFVPRAADVPGARAVTGP